MATSGESLGFRGGQCRSIRSSVLIYQRCTETICYRNEVWLYRICSVDLAPNLLSPLGDALNPSNTMWRSSTSARSAPNSAFLRHS